MMLSRQPRAALRPFVDQIWASDGAEEPEALKAAKELVLPTGAMHIAFRLGETPLRLYSDPDDLIGRDVGTSLIGGVRTEAYVKDISNPEPSVGIMLRPGAAELISGAPARALAGNHTKLDDIWRRSQLEEILERLLEEQRLAGRLAIIEDVLASRLPRIRGINPLVAHSLERLAATVRIGDVVAESGFSHRYFARTFAEAVGLPPKTYYRILRFGRVLRRLKSDPETGWADLAIAEGYADQAHMNREFREFAGVTPGQYCASSLL
jgi:AraC-like DNA-binding protein